MDIPIIGKQYTAKEIKDNGWTPCIHCQNTHLCNSQCSWAYWSNGIRENTIYEWNGILDKDNNPIYSDWTWKRRT